MMKVIIQALFLSIFFTVTLYYLLAHQKKLCKLTLVKDLRNQCKCDYLTIYDQLLRIGIYVSPSIQCGRYLIPLALEPYQLAILDDPSKFKNNFIKRFQLKFRSLYIRSKGWKILYVKDTNLDQVINFIVEYTKV